MRVSLNTVKQYINFDLPEVDTLVDKINRQLGGVEETINLAEQYKDPIIVRVVEAEQHPNADRLRICKVDDKGVVNDVPRDDNGYVQVVCGAPNAAAGMTAVWLPPKSTVPASFNDEEPFVLSARELRGVLSQGMLAAADELAIGMDHEGIVSIAESSLAPHEARSLDDLVGQHFSEAFGLDDIAIDIENKMFTHRPDLFGQLGVARELAGIHHESFVSPQWYTDLPKFETSSGLALEVFNETPENTPRFMAAVIKGVKISPSPLWLQCELVRLGGKPINNIVDITNYVMLITSQPTHAYDYAKIHGAKLGARMAKDGEKITLLNDKTYTLTADDIVIADAEAPVGLAGIMGGGESEVEDKTTDIVLEVANFDMYTVRKSAMKHGVFTDALTRFNKGQSSLQNDRVMALLIKLVTEIAGGTRASDVMDNRSAVTETRYDRQSIHDTQTVSAEFINTRLGLTLSAEEMSVLLKNVEIEAKVDGDDLIVTAPYWRTDIELPEDIVEEAGRLYGYDHLPQELPKRSTKPTAVNEYRELAEIVRQALARAGANEVLTYSFVHEDILVKAGQDVKDAYHLSNALSPDLQHYRLSLSPSLLDKVYANSKTGYDEFAIFEIGKSHSKKAGVDEDGLPVEPKRIALTYAAKTAKKGAPYYQAKQLLEQLARALNLQLEYKPLPSGTSIVAAAPFAEGRTARVIDSVSGQVIGIVGEYGTAVRKGFKLPDYSAGFELFTEGILLARKSAESKYQPLSRYPSIERDVCFEVSQDITYGDLIAEVEQGLKETEIKSDVEPIDIYQGEGQVKRITVRVRLTPYESTMTSESANEIVDGIAKAIATKIGATII